MARFRRPQIVSVRKMTDQECLRYFGKTLDEARSFAEEDQAHRQAFLDRSAATQRKATVQITYRIAEYDS